MALGQVCTVAQLIHVDPDICHGGPCCGADINVQKASEMIQVFAYVDPFEKSVFTRVCWPYVGPFCVVTLSWLKLKTHEHWCFGCFAGNCREPTPKLLEVGWPMDQ